MSTSSGLRRSIARRLLSLWIPRLPTDRLKRIAPKRGKADELPLVVAAKEGNALVLSCVDARAARLGLKPGLALTDARARRPALDVVPADATADAKLLTAIADDCERYTPLVGKDGADGLMLDITGAAHLFGGETELLGTIVRRLKGQGFSVVNAAIAGTAAAARALSRFSPNAIVTPGGEAQAVLPLPAEALLLDGAILHGLKRAGLKTIDAVASRNRKELAARFGSDLTARLDEAMGRAESPISPLRPAHDFSVEQNFAEPVANLEVAEAALAMLAARLGNMLERNGEGAKTIEATFFRADGVVRRIAVSTGRPERDPRILMRLLRTKLDSVADPLDPGFGFDLIRLAAMRWERQTPRALRFDEKGSAENDLTALVDRLGARLGSRRVLRFQLNDTHIPEHAATLVPAQGFRTAMRERLALRKRELTKRHKKTSLSPSSSCPAPDRVRSKPGHDATQFGLDENAGSTKSVVTFPSHEELRERRADSLDPAAVGEDNVVAFRACTLGNECAIGPLPTKTPDPDPPHRPVRLLVKPEPMDDVLAITPDGPPARFRWRAHLHRILRAEGPERVAMEWWRVGGAQLTRDYFRVENDAGLRLWLYRDGLYGQEIARPKWFVQGLFG